MGTNNIHHTSSHVVPRIWHYSPQHVRYYIASNVQAMKAPSNRDKQANCNKI
jgi:hypothetical protein